MGFDGLGFESHFHQLLALSRLGHVTGPPRASPSTSDECRGPRTPQGPEDGPPQPGDWGDSGFHCFLLRLEGPSFRGLIQGLGGSQRNRGSCSFGVACAGCWEGRRGHACSVWAWDWPVPSRRPRQDTRQPGHGPLQLLLAAPVSGIQQVLRTAPPGAAIWENTSSLL